MLVTSRSVHLIAAVVVASALYASAVHAQENAEGKDAALARQLAGTRVSRARGLAAASGRGRPISGKYELEDGKLQLSVYTARAERFWEVIVDHATGRVAKAEEVKEGDALTAVRSQSEAMAKAKRSLSAAVTRALRTNRGYRTVSITPSLSDGRPVASVRLVRGTAFKTVSEALD